MQANFINLAPAPSNKKALVLAAVGVIAVVGVIYACFGAPNQPSITLARMPTNYQGVEGYIIAAFGKWAQKYNKIAEYSQNGANLGHKLTAFADNFKAIKAHAETGSDVKLALNEFADMTRAEFKAKYLSLDQRVNLAKKVKNTVTLDTANLPDKVDWRDKGVVTPVKDQKQCGSCWAFSATGALEGAWALKNGSLASFSEQQIVDCSWDYGNEGCNGGLMDQAFQYTADKGIQSEDSYKYTARDGDCKADPSKVITKNSDFKDVPENDENQLAAAVADHPVAVAIEADSLVFQFYSSGIISSSSCGTDLDHGVLAVGYDASSSDPKQHYWIVKNSWGSGWGDKGYVKILKQEKSGDPGICGIAEAASYPTF